VRTFADASRVLGALEERVMQVLWTSPPMSVREVCGALRPRRSAYTTVMTTLDRLYRKGLLARSRDGIAYIYRPAMSRVEYHRRVVAAAVGELVAASAEPALAAFVDVAAELDEENLAHLERLIAARRRR
jgi:predicted transcriptional regulator